MAVGRAAPAMKITRQKHAKKYMSFYKYNFGFREPFQVLLDGTFCQAALRNKIQIRDQLPGYLAGATQLCTTRSVAAAGEGPRHAVTWPGGRLCARLVEAVTVARAGGRARLTSASLARPGGGAG